MPCTKCSTQPNFHSFRQIGTTLKGIPIWYSKPFLGIEKKFVEESIPNYLAHLDEASSKGHWVWVFDSTGLDKLEMPNPILMRKFYKIVQERYANTLQNIFMLHLNWKVKLLLDVIYPFMNSKAKERLIQCDSPICLLNFGITEVQLYRTLVDQL
jgi:hypothetical protein